MSKIIHKSKNQLDYFLNLSVIILLILVITFSRINMAYGANNNWIEVSKNNEVIQYIDTDSVNNKNRGVIEITTKYLKIDPNSSKEIEENTYIMSINCLSNKYKDISINGKKNLSIKWEAANGDKLINDEFHIAAKMFKLTD